MGFDLKKIDEKIKPFSIYDFRSEKILVERWFQMGYMRYMLIVVVVVDMLVK